jgi:DNA-binding MarR family transcriptional regulator
MTQKHTGSMNSLLADVHLAYHVLGRLVAKDLEEAAVSMSEALVLRILRLNRRTTMRELLQATGTCNSTMASLVTRLETRRFLERAQLAGDLRHTVIRPTRVGSLVGGMVASTLEQIDEGLAEYLTADEREGITLLASGLFSLEQPEFVSRLD